MPRPARSRCARPSSVLSLLVGATILTGACVNAATPATARPSHIGCAQAAAPGALCIVILGDSIGAGTPLTGDERWWPQLRRLLQDALPGRTVTIDNRAVAGSQIDLLEAAANEQPDLSTYDVAIVIEGVNDIRVSLPVDAWRPRYEVAIRAIEARGPVVIVTTPPPEVADGAFTTHFDALAAAIRDVAGDGRPLLDLAARWRADGATAATTYYVDGIHQGPAGQALMATLARDVVLAAIGGR